MVRLWNDRGFRRFGYAVLGAYVAILLRCIYRYVGGKPFPVKLLTDGGEIG